MSGIKIKIDMRDFCEKAQAELAKSPDKARGALREIANEVSGEAKDLAPFKEGHLTESIRGEVVEAESGSGMAAVIYVPSNHQAASYAIKMHENTYNLGPGSVAKQKRVGKTVGRKFITRAMDARRDRIRKIIEYHFKVKK